MNTFITFTKKLMLRYKEHSVSALSAKLTYYLILSISPFIIILLEVFRLTKFTDFIIFTNYYSLFPDSVTELLSEIFINLQSSTPSTTLPIAIIFAIWSSSRAILTLIQSLDIAYDINHKHKYFSARILAFFYMIGFILIIFIIAILLLFGGKILTLVDSILPLPSSLTFIINILRYLFSIVISFLFFTALYSVTELPGNQLKNTFPGTLICTLGITIFSFIFSIYVKHSINLNYLYGNLTDLIIFLLWLYVISNIIIIGAEVNAILSKKNCCIN